MAALVPGVEYEMHMELAMGDSPYSFEKLQYVLRCAPPMGSEPCELAENWRSKRDLLALQLADLPELARAFAESPTIPSKSSEIRFINSPASMRLGSVAEAAANTVYSMSEVAAKLANRVSNRALSSSFNKLQKYAETNPSEHPWFSLEAIRGYRRVRELRVEWTHHSSTFVLERDGKVEIVVRGTRHSSDRVEFSEQIICLPEELIQWCIEARQMLDRFGAFLLERYVLALYDLQEKVTDLIYDADGLPLIRDGRPIVRSISMRDYFQEAGITMQPGRA